VIRGAGASAERAITVAGLILTVSFAAVMLIPIQGFREIGSMLFVGLLLDTLVARPFLIPALVALFGRDRTEGAKVRARSHVLAGIAWNHRNPRR
jgi:RND superfamily putative drug exporter